MEILTFLMDERLVKSEIVGKRKRYRITEKGLDALKYFRKIEELLILTP